MVQTIPQKEGKFRIKAQFLNADDGSNQTIYDSETTEMAETGPFAPFGITYAVFGSNSSNPNNAANYSFNDGNNTVCSMTTGIRNRPITSSF